MDYVIEKSFVNKYINKNRKERILYELKSSKKRKNAVSRFCHNTSDLLNKEKIIYKADYYSERFFKEIFKEKKIHQGYIVAMDDKFDGKIVSEIDFFDMVLIDLMCVIFITDNNCVIISEEENGKRESFLLESYSR